jgi:3-hydroxyacyl-[acyl-carrier-protein] dehydratase
VTAVPAPPRPRFAAPLSACAGVTVSGEGPRLRVSAVVPIRPDTPYLEGHFPDLPIFPGVFLLEAVRQVVWYALGAPEERVPELRHLRSLRLLAPAYPGDRVIVDAQLSRLPDESEVDITARFEHTGGGRVASVDARFGWP